MTTDLIILGLVVVATLVFGAWVYWDPTAIEARQERNHLNKKWFE